MPCLVNVCAFENAVAPGPAKEFFAKFCDRVRAAHSREKVAEGVFGAYMEVSLVRVHMRVVCLLGSSNELLAIG